MFSIFRVFFIIVIFFGGKGLALSIDFVFLFTRSLTFVMFESLSLASRYHLPLFVILPSSSLLFLIAFPLPGLQTWFPLIRSLNPALSKPVLTCIFFLIRRYRAKIRVRMCFKHGCLRRSEYLPSMTV